MTTDNPMPSSNHGRRDLSVLAVCPVCQTTYHPLTTSVVAEREDAHLLYLKCRQCGSGVVAVVTTGAAGLSSVGVVTDLTSEELSHVSTDVPVQAGDVIDLYDWLEQQSSVQLTLQREKANP